VIVNMHGGTTIKTTIYFFYEVGTNPESVKAQATVIYFCLFIITSNP
jgi:hypothetical protein